MAIYYINTNTELLEVVPSQGDTILLRSGNTFSVQSLKSNVLGFSNLTLGYFGTGDRPILSGGTTITDWTYDAINDVYSKPYDSNIILGNVTEDGIPMRFTAWDGSLSATLPKMSTGRNSNIWAGSMTVSVGSGGTNTLYIRPSSGSVGDHHYIVSDKSRRGDGVALYSESPTENVKLSGVEFRHISTHGIVIHNAKNLLIEDFIGRYIGGRYNGYYYYGNALELSKGCHGYIVKNSAAYDIFDSAFTTQLYDNNLNTFYSSSNGLYENIHAERFGMAATEFSVHGSSQTRNYLTDVLVNRLVAVDGGVNSFARGRGGKAFVVTSNIPLGKVNNVFAKDVTALRCNMLYNSYNSNGINGMQDSIGIESFAGESNGQSNASVSNSSYTHIDLLNNVIEPKGMNGFTTINSQPVKNVYGFL